MENEFSDLQGFRSWWQRYRQRWLAQGSPEHWQQQMLMSNPNFILRNHLAQVAIEQAQKGDMSELARLQQVLAKPYDEQPGFEAYANLPPEWSKELEISCSR